jgi:hypothetical protein
MVAQYVSEKISDLSAFIFFGILHGYVSKMYPMSIGIEYVSRYPIRYGLKYPCFIGSVPSHRTGWRCFDYLSEGVKPSG